MHYFEKIIVKFVVRRKVFPHTLNSL